MRVSRKIMPPLAILKAIESLSEAEKETLAILADEKLSRELMKRRQEAFIEMKKGELISEKELFRDSPEVVRRIECFEAFSDRIAEKFRENDITEEDVPKAVEWSRKTD